ncbi:MAG: hypothetical protein KGJ03_10075 [Betaproteobacteria bacterium]|nr:hypothetical protein [Betaproteobacteria bacterium]MBU6510999.1 hypothetical protein [Betaproteobacteria bacterium]MDE1956059.1 hypothetical protein [Betaproteobacteria bacterium]MDE2150763.1 hypothetical protein [Betaproteobacteria bacterium]MDE2479378.1 hypothetical protein [Betaproteobacteria bacterium]
MANHVQVNSSSFEYSNGVIVLSDKFRPDNPIKVDLKKLWLPATPFSNVEPIANNLRLSAFLLDVAALFCIRRKNTKSAAGDVARHIRTIAKFIEFLYVEGIYDPSECDRATIRVLLSKLTAGGWSEALRIYERTEKSLQQIGSSETRRIALQPGVRVGVRVGDRIKRLLGTNCSGSETAAAREAILDVVHQDRPRRSPVDKPRQLTSSALLAIFSTINLTSDLADGRGLAFLPFPNPSLLANKHGRPDGRTRNLRPEDVGALLAECFSWIYRLAGPLAELLNTLAFEMVARRPENSGARAALAASVLTTSVAARTFEAESGLRIRNIRVRHSQAQTECTLSEAIDCVLSACFIVISFFNARRKDEVQHPVIGLKDNSLRAFDEGLGLYVCSFYLEKFTKDYREFFVNDATVAAMKVLQSFSEIERKLSGDDGGLSGRSLFRVPTLRAKFPLTRRMFEFNRSRSAKRLLQRAFGESEEGLSYAPHMGRRAYGLIMIHRFSEPSLLALSQQYDHHGLDATNIYLSDASRGNTLEQLEGFGRLRTPPAEVIEDLEAAIDEVSRERLKEIVDVILRGEQSMQGRFPVFVNRLHDRIAARLKYDDADLRDSSTVVAEALLAKGHKVVAFRHGDCCASAVRSSAARCSRGSGRPRRERASPQVCATCAFHSRSLIHVQAMTLGVAHLRQQLSGLPVGCKPWKQLCAEIRDLEQAIAESQRPSWST